MLRTFTCSTDSACSFETSVFSVTTSQESLHTQHAEPRGAFRQLLTPLVAFIFQGLPRHHVRLRVASYESCRASRCTQATYESTLSPTHLMQQLLAFVHLLLKLKGTMLMARDFYHGTYVGATKVSGCLSRCPCGLTLDVHTMCSVFVLSG